MYVCPIYPSVNTVCIHLTFYINLEKSKTSKLLFDQLKHITSLSVKFGNLTRNA